MRFRPPWGVPTPETTEGDDRQSRLLSARGPKVARMRAHQAASVAPSPWSFLLNSAAREIVEPGRVTAHSDATQIIGW
jgi:hypothetical protein